MESELMKYIGNVDEVIKLLKQKAKRIEDERDALQARCVRYEKALQDVVNPQGYLQRKAEEEGSQLNSIAFMLANDAAFIKNIANQALNGEGGKDKEPIFPTAVYRQQGSKTEIKKEQPNLGDCQRCNKEYATTTYGGLKVCTHCNKMLNNEFDEEYR